MASNSALKAVPAGGMLQGYRNLAAKETGDWWKTRMWLVQTLIWAAIANGMLVMVLWVAPRSAGGAAAAMGRELLDTGLQIFTIIGTLAAAVGVVIIGQDAIVDEKRSGTAAWILSKPISRSAFVLAKFFAHALGILVTMVLIQGAIACAQISAATRIAPSLFGWLAALALMYLVLLFFLSLTLMLGALFDGRGPVIGIPMILIFGYQLFLGVVPQLANYLPYPLTITIGMQESLAVQLMKGGAISNLLPIICTVLWTVLFMSVAIWRFGREEF